VEETSFPIERWTAGRTKLVLTAGGRSVRIPVAGPVPYSKPTSGSGVSAPLFLVPAGRPIDASAAGKIVIRPAPAGSIPNLAFTLPGSGWTSYDPNGTIDPGATFYGDFIAYNDRVADLRDAAAAGVAGLLFVKELPRTQLVDHYEPYEGTQWGVPG